VYGATRQDFDIYVLLPPVKLLVEFWAAAAPPTSGGSRSRLAPRNGNEIVCSVPCVDKRHISADRGWVLCLCRNEEPPPPDMGRPVRPQSHGRLLYFQLLSHYLDYKDGDRAGRMNKARDRGLHFGARWSRIVGRNGTFLLHSTGYHRLIALLDSPPPSSSHQAPPIKFTRSPSRRHQFEAAASLLLMNIMADSRVVLLFSIFFAARFNSLETLSL
jgi:hypothetical protein